MVLVGRHARVRLHAGRRVPDLSGEIWCCLVLLLLAVELWWSEPEAVVSGAAGTSINKGPFFVRFTDGAVPHPFFSWPAMVARGRRRAERVPLERKGGGGREVRSAVLVLDLMRAGMQLSAASFKLTRRRGFGGRSAWVAPRPTRVWWSKEDGSVVGALSRWCCCVDLRPGEGWRCPFIVLGSVAVRRTTLAFKACSSSRLVVSGLCGIAFSGDGEGIAIALIRVSPRRIPVLAYVLYFVLCIF